MNTETKQTELTPQDKESLDLFASCAMIAIMQSMKFDAPPEVIADMAYSVAEAMLKKSKSYE